MARIPAAALDGAGLDGVEGDVLRRILDRRGGALRPLDEVLLHSPELADGWNGLLGAIRDRLALPAAVRELVILRIAVLNGASYEWAAHEPIAGFSEERLSALRSGDVGPFDSRERAVLAYTDGLVLDGGRVHDEVFAVLRAHLPDEQILELTYVTCLYEMHATMARALRLEWDDRPDPIVEVPAPEGYGSRDIADEVTVRREEPTTRRSVT